MVNHPNPPGGEALPLVTVHGDRALTTSLIIAEGIGVQHKNVLETIHAYTFQFSAFGDLAFETRANTQGPPTRFALLNELQATLLIALSRNTPMVVDFKVALIRAFHALKIRLAEPSWNVAGILVTIPRTIGDALRTIADVSEKAEELEKKVLELAPDADAAHRIGRADGSVCITDAAKILKVGPKVLFRTLEASRWIYRRPGNTAHVGYQDKIQRGLLEHRVITIRHTDGEETIKDQVLVTAKGLIELAKLLGGAA